MNAIVIASARRPPAILRFLLAVALVVVAYILTAFALGQLGLSPLGFALSSSVLLLMLVCGFCGLLFSLDRVRSSLLEAAGLPLGGQSVHDAALGVSFGVAALSLAVAVVAVVGRAGFHYTRAHPARLALTLWALVAAAMVEEATFRGYPLHRLIEAIGTPAAVVVTSCLFGLAHMSNPHASWWGAVNTAEIGVLLALAYVRTRALWLPWGIHFGWNLALGVGYGLVVSGFSGFSDGVAGSLQGPRWLTGGEYGIEASLTATIVILVAIVVLLVLVKQRPAPQLVVAGVDPPRIIPDSGPAPGIE
ncbi:MAG TPA: CPBP family intramembrane glutamic endopeptidase [Terriglobales bacterium]|nr:CPBP family intramembrane glutamic endopeptidase [Terriglobales bacterium]